MLHSMLLDTASDVSKDTGSLGTGEFSAERQIMQLSPEDALFDGMIV